MREKDDKNPFAIRPDRSGETSGPKGPEPPPTAFGSSGNRSWLEIGGVVAIIALVLGGFWWAGGAIAEWGAGKLPYSVDQSIGKHAADQQLEDATLCTNEALTGAVEGIVGRLATGLDEEYRDLNVYVVETEQVNAFALPGGYIFVLTGLLEKLESPEELIGVLGHEIGHVVHRHGVKRVARSLWLRFLVAYFFGDLGSAGDILTVGASQLIGLKFDRDQERESDVFGLDLMVKTGIEPGTFPNFFTRLPGGSMPDWFLTHPNPQERADELKEKIAALSTIEAPWKPPSLEALQAPCHAPTKPTDAPDISP